jgi:hypothetical protein
VVDHAFETISHRAGPPQVDDPAATVDAQVQPLRPLHEDEARILRSRDLSEPTEQRSMRAPILRSAEKRLPALVQAFAGDLPPNVQSIVDAVVGVFVVDCR